MQNDGQGDNYMKNVLKMAGRLFRVLVLLMGMLAALQSVAGAETIFSSDIATILSLAFDNDKIFILDGQSESIHVYSTAGEFIFERNCITIETISESNYRVHVPYALCYDENGAYLIMSDILYSEGLQVIEGANLYRLLQGNADFNLEWLCKLDWDIMTTYLGQNQYNLDIEGICCANERIYLQIATSLDKPESTQTVLSFSMRDGTVTIREYENLVQIMNGNDDTYVVCLENTDGVYEQCAISTDGEAKQIACVQSDDNTISHFACGTHKVFYLSDGQVIQYDVHTGISTALMPMGYSEPIGAYLFKNRYYAIFGRTYVCLCDTQAGIKSEVTVLTIGGNVQPPDELMNGYLNTSPTTTYRFVNMNESTDIIDSLLMQSNEIDVFCINTAINDVYDAILKRGYYYPIEDIEVNACVNRMYDGIISAVKQNGELAAFPIENITQNSLGVNEEVRIALGMTESEMPKNWIDMMHFIQNWDAIRGRHSEIGLFQGMNADSLRSWFERRIVSDYALQGLSHTELISYNTDVFHELMLTFENTDFSGHADEIADRFLFSTNYVLSSRNTSSKYTGCVLGLNSTYTAITKQTLTVLIINPYSPNKEEALQFIRYMSQNLTPVASADMIPSQNTAVRSEDFGVVEAKYKTAIADFEGKLDAGKTIERQIILDELNRLQEEYHTYLDNAWLLSEKSIAAYRMVVEPIRVVSMEIPKGSKGNTLESARIQYLQGVLDLDGYIQVLNRVYVMSKEEG